MIMSRRSFLLASAGATAALSPLAHAAQRLARQPAAQAKAATFLEWRPLKPGLTAGIGGGGNSLVIADKEFATLVDTKYSWLGAQLRREADAATQKITQVINTHHHGDHTGGNHAFSADVAIIAHENAKPRILAQTQQYVSGVAGGRKELANSKGETTVRILSDIAEFEKNAASIKPESWAPTKTVSDGEELKIGGITVVLRHFGAGHTDNDLVLHLPDQNVIHTGDLLFNKVYPYVDRSAKANTKGWINSLNQIAKLAKDDTIIVPGHGEISNKAAIAEQIKYFEDMLVFVREQIKAGKSKDEISKMNPAPYDSYNVPWIRPITLGGIFDEVKAEG
jgi:cyclase